ncbi:MAG: efflux RND transporter periplasmic adaptor subunit [Candidatus Eremiobacteraeota bacterium]|nr:efflux RND transporter periplasmic adaptor subunit [Candidatus Eremiobacteraeota bacterium]
MNKVLIILLTLFLMGCGNDKTPQPSPSPSNEHSEEEHEHGHDEQGEVLSLSADQVKELGIVIEPVAVASGQSTGIRPGRIVADPDSKVLLSSQVAGTLSQFHVQVGANVLAGTLVAEIRSPEVTALQAEYHEAEVESELAAKELANTTSLLEVADDVKRPLEQASLELSKAQAERDASAARLKSEVLKNDRLETLLEEGIASRQQVEESRAQRQALEAELKQAEAAVEIAQNHLKRETRVTNSDLRVKAETFPAEARLARAQEAMRHARERLHQLGASPESHDGSVLLYSPISGQVVERPLTRGELVAPGTSVATVVDTSKVWVWIDLQRSDLEFIKVDSPITLSLVENPKITQDGRLDYLAPQLEETTQTVRARVVLTNPSPAFRLGSFVNAKVSEGSGVSTPTVPQSAVQFVEGQTVVYRAEHDGEFVRTPVELGSPVSDSTVSVSGLKEGDRIVTDGAEQLKSLDLSDEIGGHSH